MDKRNKLAKLPEGGTTNKGVKISGCREKGKFSIIQKNFKIFFFMCYGKVLAVKKPQTIQTAIGRHQSLDSFFINNVFQDKT